MTIPLNQLITAYIADFVVTILLMVYIYKVNKKNGLLDHNCAICKKDIRKLNPSFKLRIRYKINWRNPLDNIQGKCFCSPEHLQQWLQK